MLPQRGLKKGNPLSPNLFILVVEGLSTMIKAHEIRGNIHGIAISEGASKVYICYLGMIASYSSSSESD